MRPSSLTAVLVAMLALVGCPSEGDREGAERAPERGPLRVEVTAVDYAFVAPDSVPSGWVSFRLDNETASEAHEIVLDRLPGGRTMEEVGEEVVPAYDSIFSLVERGEVSGPEEIADLASKLMPTWYGEVALITDQGVVSPGRVARRTVYLEPGTYELACFVRAPDGAPHLVKGMIRKLVVTENSVDGSPPEPDVTIAVAGDSIRSPDTIAGGDVTVRARLGDGRRHNTVHLVRAGGETDPTEVKRWRAVWTPDGRQVPAPTEFLGGHALFGNTPAGHTAHFTAEGVEPGQYAWLVSGMLGRPENAIWKPVVVR